MKKRLLFPLLFILPILAGCGTVSSSSIDLSSLFSDPSSYSFSEAPFSYSVDSQELENKKADAINEIKNYVNKDNYYEKEQQEIEKIIQEAIEYINKCKSLEGIDSVLDIYEDKLLEVKTISQYELEALKNEKTLLNMYKTTEQIDYYKNLGYTNLYQDPTFQKGFIVTKNSTAGNPYHDEYLRYYDSVSKTPDWTIAQWSTRYDIMSSDEKGGYTLTRDEEGLVNTITSKGQEVEGEFVPAKVLTLNTKTGSAYLECNTSVEYEQHRTGSEGWVHLLLSQDFGNNLVNVSSCSSIVMDAKYTINKCVNQMGSAYNSSKHAAQLVWYITVQNRNTSSAGYGRYIWFGIGLWDNRSEGKKMSEYVAHDAGTDTLIYNPASSVYYTDTMGVLPKIGEEGHANVDIWPIVKQAFETSKTKGYLANTNWEDLYIGGTNFGYEVPGTFDISSTIDCINVFYK